MAFVKPGYELTTENWSNREIAKKLFLPLLPIHLYLDANSSSLVRFEWILMGYT